MDERKITTFLNQLPTDFRAMVCTRYNGIPGIYVFHEMAFAAGTVFPDWVMFYAACSFGDGCRFGENCKFGDGYQFGDRCEFGTRCKFGNGCQFGDGCKFGDRCRFGECCTVGGRAAIGCSVHIGRRFSAGEFSVVHSGFYIDEDAQFGPNCRILRGTFVSEVKFGSGCCVLPAARVYMAGYGYTSIAQFRG